MSDKLERRYARLLAAYPADYRRSRGAEVLGTLLDAAEPGRTRPPLREAAALLVGALRAHAGAPRRRTVGQTWLPAFRTAALMLMVNEAAVSAVQTTMRLANEDFASGAQLLLHPDYLPVAVLALAVAAIVAVVRHRYGTAVVLAAAGSAVVLAIPFPAGAFGHSAWRLPLAIVLLLPLLRRGAVTASGVLKYLPVVPVLLSTVALFSAGAGAAAVPIQFAVFGAVCLACLAWSAVDERVALALGLLLVESLLWQLSEVYVFGLSPVLVTAVAPAILLAVGATVARRQARL